MTTPSEMFAEGADQAPRDTTTGSDQTTDQTSDTMFIGEGKKYASISDADKAIAFKDDHISKVEIENAELREKVASASTVDDVIESIKNQNLERDTFDKTRQENHQSLDVDAIVAKAVHEQLNQAETTRTAASNSQEVFKVLTDQYGDKGLEVYQSKAKELGIDLDSLSQVSPKAVLEFFKTPTTTQVQSGSYTSSSVNTANLNKGQPAQGTVDYWDSLHSQGKITREEKFKQQHKSLEAMGAANFYNK